MQNRAVCKICGAKISIYEHTAKCTGCGVLLNYPYFTDDELLQMTTNPRTNSGYTEWYNESSFYNHTNFTNMLRFVLDRTKSGESFSILDYGGGGGQFALIAKSHIPGCEVYITDIFDDALQQDWAPMNKQILFNNFKNDETRFEYIFLNDVFEHVNDPVGVLVLLKGKLKEGGQIFIDTPKQFWLYPVLRLLYRPLYRRLIKGTVDADHLQIWSRKSFGIAIDSAGLQIIKYKELSEYTMPAEYYLNGMGIKNHLIRLLGRIFYANARWLAKNKIMCVASLITDGAKQ